MGSPLHPPLWHRGLPCHAMGPMSHRARPGQSSGSFLLLSTIFPPAFPASSGPGGRAGERKRTAVNQIGRGSRRPWVERRSINETRKVHSAWNCKYQLRKKTSSAISLSFFFFFPFSLPKREKVCVSVWVCGCMYCITLSKHDRCSIKARYRTVHVTVR